MLNFSSKDVKELVRFLGDNRVARFKGMGIEVDLHPDVSAMMEQPPQLNDQQLQDEYLNRRAI
mgnify:FL=1